MGGLGSGTRGRTASPLVVSGWMPNDEFDFTAGFDPVFDVARELGLDEPAGFLPDGRVVTYREIYAQGIPPQQVITHGQFVGRVRR